MGTQNIHDRENEMNSIIFSKLSKIKNLHLLAKRHTDRLGIFSFFIVDTHYNLIVKLLNDRYGIQTRGGCSCAGTYGHFLLHVDHDTSKEIEKQILDGCMVERPGWIRMSIHPTMTTQEIEIICEAIKEVAENHEEWAKEYKFEAISNEFIFVKPQSYEADLAHDWFN